MKKLTDEELRKAYGYWHTKYEARDAEKALSPFLNDQIMPFSLNQCGWLKKAREGLFLSASSVAKRLKVTRTAYSKYEENEEKGAITLATLARAAEAMDCELVYAIRPKNKKYFSNIIWEKLLPATIIHPWIKKCDQRRRDKAVAFIASRYMMDAKFRKQQAWSQRANSNFRKTPGRIPSSV